MDLSTAILTLSENGDLQRIHDKWLTHSSCSLDNAEIESDRLHLQSFAGLFLICGIACFIALLIYFIKIMLKFRKAADSSSITQDQGTSRSSRLQTLLSLIDEKKDESPRDRKRRKMDRCSSSDDSHGIELGRNPKRSQTSVDNNVL